MALSSDAGVRAADGAPVRSGGSELREHPAVRRWTELGLEGTEPIGIVRLQSKAKGKVYRLAGVGPHGSNVIAKQSSRARIHQERAMYEHVLPELPISRVRYYGFVNEPETDYAWLFLEDGGGEAYSPADAQHRALAARWLGLLHTSAACLPAAAWRLPDRGPSYYLEHLRSACDTITCNLTNPALTRDDVTVLSAIVRQCEVVAAHWSVVERFCAAMPHTLIHGDFAPKNMRVRPHGQGLTLAPFDWGSAGWGVAAADLVQWGTSTGWGYWASPDLDMYSSVVRDRWPELAVEHLRTAAWIGKVFRCLVCVSLSAQSFATEWVERAARNMRIYETEMRDALQSGGWLSRGEA
jgi:hypothetical protein